jgi:deoxycytidine triphosphate deaminase
VSGVLSGSAIIAFAEAETSELIVEGYQRASVQPASYNVTIAETGLITREGKIPPARPEEREDANEKQRATAQSLSTRLRDWIPLPTRPPVVLEPGDTAVFASRERFELPMRIAGNVTVKNTFAAKGLMLLSGMLIDPGYGKGDAHGDGRPGCPLYLHVANIGRERMVLIPGVHDIARVQFLHVDEETDTTDLVSGSLWKNQELVSLGFLSELKGLKENVEQTDRRTQLVLGGGVVVILVALIAAAFSSILSIAADQELTGDLQRTWGSLSLGQSVLWASLIVGVPVLMLVIILGASKIGGWLLGFRRLKKRRS